MGAWLSVQAGDQTHAKLYAGLLIIAAVVIIIVLLLKLYHRNQK